MYVLPLPYGRLRLATVITIRCLVPVLFLRVKKKKFKYKLRKGQQMSIRPDEATAREGHTQLLSHTSPITPQNARSAQARPIGKWAYMRLHAAWAGLGQGFYSY